MTSISVTSLGLWDKDSNGLADSHTGAIWDAAGSIVVQGTVVAGTSAPLLARFRYVSVAATVLSAGASYTVGAHYPTTADFASSTNPPNVATAAGLTLQGYRFNGTNLGFNKPLNSTAPWSSVGGTFQFNVVPEPATAGLFAMGLAGLAAAARRRSFR